MKQQRFWTIVIFFILLLGAACGPAGRGTGEPSIEEAESPRTIEDVFATNVTNEETMDTAPIADEAEIDAVAEPTDSPLLTATPQAGPTAIESEGKAVDSNGLEIGFTEDGHAYRGSLDAPVILEEFSDFQCPFCARFAHETLPSLLENQIANGEVAIIYYDFPLTSIHPQAMAAANAARCAGEQTIAAYWEMHDLLFINPAEWSNEAANNVFAQYGQQIGLEAESFVACLSEGRYVEAVEADFEYGRSRNVSSTPSFFLNDQMLVGAQPLNIFNQAIAVIQDGGEIASANQGQTSNNQAAEVPTPAPIDYEAVAMALGDANAPVRIVEFTDYQCPFCQRHFAQTLPQLLSQMIDTGRVYYMVKDLPLESIHPQARLAANAARCAGEQEAYKEMHDLLFTTQNEWGGQNDEAAQQVFDELASQLTLDIPEFSQCVQERRYDDLIQANIDEAVSFGVRGTPFFFIDGFPINGAQPYELFEFAVGRAEEGTLAEAYRPQGEQQQQPPPPPTQVEVDITGSYSIGEPDAPITIVEFTDFQCPFCQRHFAQTLPGLIEEYVETGVVQYVFKDFPLTQIHPQAFIAAEAARCAWDQEAYMEMHDLLFNTQTQWNGQQDAADIFVTYADQLGLDTAVFSECLTSHQHQDAVNADLQYGLNLGIRGTPTFVVNGRLFSGAQSLTYFEEMITDLMEENSN